MPGIDDPEDDNDDGDKALGPSEAKAFRFTAARCNYFAVDRPDLLFPVKERRREMRAPTTRSMGRLKRVGKYLCYPP